jgi:hypothetical protein
MNNKQLREVRSALRARDAEPLAQGCRSRLEIAIKQHPANTNRDLLARQHRIYADTWNRKISGNERTPRF